MSAPRRFVVVVAAASLAAASLAGSAAIDRPASAASLAVPIVRAADAHDVSAPLASLIPVRPPFGREGVFEPEIPERPDLGRQPVDRVQQTTTTAQMPAPNLTFEGQRDADNFPFLVEPPDPN
ncbi:MAG: hypothetical protein ACJ761_10310, partial [Chloroflexota bacterium]